MNAHRIEVMLLGTSQDGGLPQLGCECAHCQAAWADETRRRFVTSLGVIDHQVRKFWLVDASPDVGAQVRLLVTSVADYPLAGVLLTHAHIGHYLGLAFLGRESWNRRQLPVLCTRRMAAFLGANQPWKQLIQAGNIALSILEPGTSVSLSPNVSATPLPVPHRDELSDTMAYLIAGPGRRLLYCPDIDRWEGDILAEIRRSDVALLDGTFYAPDELPGRNLAEIPHPCIIDSLDVFAGYDTRIQFTHLNHSNRALGDPSLVEQLQARGFTVAEQGSRLRL